MCDINLLGVLLGKIVAFTDAGYHLRPSPNPVRQARIAERLAWHADHATRRIEQRNGARIVPQRRDTIVRLPDASLGPGIIADLSMSGARIELAVPRQPLLGASVTVGRRYASVVRVDDASIAVCFRLPFSQATFNAALRL